MPRVTLVREPITTNTSEGTHCSASYKPFSFGVQHEQTTTRTKTTPTPTTTTSPVERDARLTRETHTHTHHVTPPVTHQLGLLRFCSHNSQDIRTDHPLEKRHHCAPHGVSPVLRRRGRSRAPQYKILFDKQQTPPTARGRQSGRQGGREGGGRWGLTQVWRSLGGYTKSCRRVGLPQVSGVTLQNSCDNMF